MTDHPHVTSHLGEHWGHAVRKRRDECGHSQAELAGQCGVTQQTISKIERGALLPRDELKILLAHHLDCSPVDLFSWPALGTIASNQ